MSALQSLARAECRFGLEVVNVFNAIFDEKGLFKARELKARHAAIQFLEHGLEDGVFFGVGSCGFCGCRSRRDEVGEKEKNGSEQCRGTKWIHWASFVAATTVAPGMGSTK